jgi:hypothetical protein
VDAREREQQSAGEPRKASVQHGAERIGEQRGGRAEQRRGQAQHPLRIAVGQHRLEDQEVRGQVLPVYAVRDQRVITAIRAHERDRLVDPHALLAELVQPRPECGRADQQQRQQMSSGHASPRGLRGRPEARQEAVVKEAPHRARYDDSAGGAAQAERSAPRADSGMAAGIGSHA